MRLCPACGNQFPDDANFCPMDATKLPPPAVAATIPVASPPSRSAPDAPTVMDGGATAIGGRFLILGGGGTTTPTGQIHEARDTSNGGQVVSLKMVKLEVLPNPTMADRALRELKQLAKVTSDRIVRVIDQGKGSDGAVYVATEVVSGPSLEDLVTREGPLPVERATAIVLQIGEALTEAQKVGVIHRDVAPRNVFVQGGDKVKVGEFGLAEAVNDKVFGAPAYLSPEQVEGKAVDQRSNIYSLGAIFYYALTGRPPFQGDAQSLLSQQLSATPQPPSSQRAGLPAEIDRIILKALEKSGGRRHLTLRQLLSEIEAAASQAKPAGHTSAPKDDVAGARTVMQFAPSVNPSPENAAKQADSTVMGVSSQKPAASNVGEMRTMMAEAPRAAPVSAAQPVAQPTTVDKKPINAPDKVQAAVAAAQANVAAQKAAAVAAAPPAKAGFRETAWFKAGEIQEEMEKAQAAASNASGGDVLGKAGTTDQHKAVVDGEVDMSKVDVDAQDKARLSLKTGATQMMTAVSAPKEVVKGERMDEQEMLAEIDSSKKWFIIAGAIVGVVILAVVLYFVLGSKKAEEPKKAEAPQSQPEAVAAAPPAAKPPSVSAAVTPTPPPTPPPAAKPPTPPPSASPAQLLSDAKAAAAKDNATLAVDLLTKAAAAGADAKEVKKAESIVGKAIAKKLATAKKKKDKEGETEAKNLAARLASLKAAKRK